MKGRMEARMRARPWEKRRSKNDGWSHIYIHSEGETIVDQLFARHNRPYNVVRKEMGRQIERKVRFYLSLANPAFTTTISQTPMKLQWSQYCGCSCPCSPGFLVKFAFTDQYSDKVRFDSFYRNVDFWLTVREG